MKTAEFQSKVRVSLKTSSTKSSRRQSGSYVHFVNPRMLVWHQITAQHSENIWRIHAHIKKLDKLKVLLCQIYAAHLDHKFSACILWLKTRWWFVVVVKLSKIKIMLCQAGSLQFWNEMAGGNLMASLSNVEFHNFCIVPQRRFPQIWTEKWKMKFLCHFVLMHFVLISQTLSRCGSISSW